MKRIHYIVLLFLSIISIYYVHRYLPFFHTLTAQDYCIQADRYKEQNQFTQAIIAYKSALKLSPHDFLISMKLGDTLCLAQRYDEALAICQETVKHYPQQQFAIGYNMAMTYEKMGNLQEAIYILKQITQHRPNWASPHLNLAFDLLKLGDLKNGLREYEWRWQATNIQKLATTKPEWDGSDVRGKTVLIYAEQGFGDTLHFIRYAQILKNMGARVLVFPQTALIPLLKLCPYIDHVLESATTLPPFDYHIATMSLPYACRTELETIPANIPYLYADASLVNQWNKTLAQDKNFKIGICWHGNPRYTDLSHQQTVKAKSIPLQLFEPLSKIPQVSLYSLQQIGGQDELHHINFKVHTFDNDFDTVHGRFMDTAAVIQNLDLIITIDTSISHLAAGLGKPVWILLPNPHDWRWFLNRTDSPWYPNVQLFRQPTRGDWNNVIQTVAQQLRKQLTEKSV
ncbi:MAG TPA: tetratricopeptide repeat-containing glycosyltransferase family protein [Candidatus Dependentiae bacterium]|nr:tetratricopeptide repeat-containing glycosyltransferase family protein [Candidatus Dependentiae bacterium]HRQ62274.1 tetratricopeptide repeat-containing glycosyltransferase family protein [Candidatus Dependentiae bacterium]